MSKVSFSSVLLLLLLLLLLYYNKLLIVTHVENWEKNRASHCQ
jgi:hypothetical protein